MHLRIILGAMQFHFSHSDTSTFTLFDYLCGIVGLLHEQIDVTTDPKESVLEAIYRIVARPWFTRVWVVQELALSKLQLYISAHIPFRGLHSSLS